MDFVEHLFLASLLLLFLWGRRLQRKSDNDIKNLPGPLQLPFLGNALQLATDNALQTCHNWSKKYGMCFRLSVFNLDFVAIASPELVKSVLASNDLGHLHKSAANKFLEGFTGMAFSNGEKWRKMRLLMSPSFHFKTYNKQVAIINKHADRLVKTILTKQAHGEKINFSKLIANVVTKIVIDSYVSCKAEYTDSQVDLFLKNFKTYTTITAYRILHPWLGIEFLWKRHSLHENLEEAMNGINNFARLLVEDRVEQLQSEDIKFDETELKKRRSEPLDILLDAGLSLAAIEKEVASILFAHEANSLTLLYCVFILALNPDHQDKCRQEVDSLGKSEISLDDVRKLNYVEACLLETLRLFSPVFMFGRELQTPLPLPNGVNLPTGTNLLICSDVIHKNPEIYPNPEQFRPERFFLEEIKKRHPYAFLPFSAGPRVCLGMKTSIIQMKIILAKILRKFTVSTEDKLEDIRFRLDLTMYPEKEFSLKFTQRVEK